MAKIEGASCYCIADLGISPATTTSSSDCEQAVAECINIAAILQKLICDGELNSIWSREFEKVKYILMLETPNLEAQNLETSKSGNLKILKI